MPTPIGSPLVVVLPDTASPGAQALGADVPSGANLCLAFLAGSNDAGMTLSSLGSNFTAAAFVVTNHPGFTGYGAQFGVAKVTSSGSGKTITPVWSTTVGYGPTCMLRFYSVADPDACVADLSAAGGNLFLGNSGDNTPVTGAVNSATGDIIANFDTLYTTSSALPNALAAPWSSVQTQADLRGATARLSERAGAAGTTTGTTSDNTAYSSLIVARIRDSGSPPPTPVLSSPSAAQTGPNSSSGQVTTDTGSGTLYWLTTTASTATDAAIKAGSSQTVSASGVQNTTSAGLSPSTTYYTFFIQTVGGVDSVQVRSASFTTPSAGTPPTVAITAQSIAGQSVTLSGTYTGTPTSATATVPAATVPNGAVTQGPSAVTYSAGTWSITFTGLSPGDYDAPSVTMSNASGSDTDTGAAFTVMEIDGGPEAPNPGNTEETVTPVDSQDRTTARIGAAVESVAPVDSQAATPAITRATAEAVAAADSQNRTTTMTAARADTVAPSDTQTGTPGITRATPETVAPVDAQDRTLAAAAAQADTLAPAEAQNASTVFGNSVQDNLALSDTEGMSAGLVRDTPEALATADQQSCLIGKQAAVSEAVDPADVVSGLVVMGTTTVESLVGLADSANGVVSSIVGMVDEVVVLTEQQFQSLIVAGGVLEFVQVEDQTDSAPIITPLTVVEQVDLRDTTSRLRYPKPPGPGNSQVRRFIVYYK